ncbi:MAG: glycerophosphodiester phosphodiesterase [Chitinophagales bacterium]
MLKPVLIFLLLSLTIPLISLAQERPPEKFDVQGHRGCRGLYPENSIPGFIHAVDLGVTTLEIDVVITKDNKVILSHEPYMSPQICLDREGNELPEDSREKLNIYEMNYDEIREYDCGSKPHPQFSEQKKVKVHKPLLSEVIDEVENYTKANKLEPVFYNIETKTTEEGDHIYHPEPSEFVDLLIDELNHHGIEDRVIIQSFDPRTLEVVKVDYPNYKTALLLGQNQKLGEQLKILGSMPDILSPHYSLVNQGLMAEMNSRNIQVVPWTVNEQKDMLQMIEHGIKAIITDYPDRLLKLLEEN